tara:strand:- start:616 stop:1161 length:546 start_codon:yes stop_codon:yes gene_type:complete
MLDVNKTKQMAAKFIDCSGGTINIMSLVKLIYLADRKALDKYETPISGDSYVSMTNGPVPSSSYDLIKGVMKVAEWSDLISERVNHKVGLTRTLEGSDLDYLCEDDLDIIESIWSELGHLSQYELVVYSHENCKEWQDPKGSSIPISYEDIFLKLGRSEEDANDLAARIVSFQSLGEQTIN